jgi:hypothetical protein
VNRLGPLVTLTAEQRDAFGRKPQAVAHRLHESAIFRDDSLVALIDGYPRQWLQAFTMGTDPEKREDWAPVEIGDIGGNDLLEAVRRGRLWLNILNTQKVDPRFKQILDQLYDELAAQCSGFETLMRSGTLLISSPGAQVYYHVDGPPNFLWHIRGEKRVYVYPAGDRRLVSQEIMEDVFASAADEEMPYKLEWDRFAVVFDLKPGHGALWPQNSPHRVVNADTLNVSLATNHSTVQSEHRKLVYLANRFFHRRCGLPLRSVEERGTWPRVKTNTYRVCRRLGLDQRKRSFDYRAVFRVDPGAPDGVSRLETEIRVGFGK